tara:strand:+ start:1333 stop:1941 length:609 start_codon:yes stop_codon:yes gene_type:complete
MLTDLQLLRLVKDGYEEKTSVVKELEYSVYQYDDCQVIVIRGTEITGTEEDGLLGRIKNLRDVIRDIRILPWKIKGMPWGHSGFVKGARDVLEHSMPRHLKYDKPIICTGHSLGGAIALALGVFLKKLDNKQSVQVVTFGAPRVFLFKQKINAVMYRNGKDIVSTVPYGRHPVKQTRVGKVTTWLPCVKDHFLSKYIGSKLK